MLSGVAVGGGWQGIVAYINLGCYYIFGLPFGFLLGYTANLGVTVSKMLQFLMFVIFFCNVTSAI